MLLSFVMIVLPLSPVIVPWQPPPEMFKKLSELGPLHAFNFYTTSASQRAMSYIPIPQHSEILF